MGRSLQLLGDLIAFETSKHAGALGRPAGVVDGYVFRPVNRGDQVQGDVLSEKVVWQLLRPYATAAGSLA